MITYSAVVSYFKEFADKHLQINSFSYGSADKIELKKINEYPALHITLTNTDISDKVVVYDFDVYVLSAIDQQSENDEQVKESAYSDTLMIMQDLRAEFTEGKYIVNTNQLLLQGSNELSCTPIEEKFNNMVIGFSTSINVESANETTECTIPYNKYKGENIIESWDGDNFTPPVMDKFDSSYYWFSAKAQVVGKLTYNQSEKQISNWYPVVDSNFLIGDEFSKRTSSTTEGVFTYSYKDRAIHINKPSGEISNLYTELSNWSDKQLYVIIKLKKVKQYTDTISTKANELLQFQSTLDSNNGKLDIVPSENGLRFTAATGNIELSSNIEDGSSDYIRESSITIGIALIGDIQNTENDNKTRIWVDGNLEIEIANPVSVLKSIKIGGLTSDTETDFMVEEVYIKQDNSSDYRGAEFEKVLSWIKNR